MKKIIYLFIFVILTSALSGCATNNPSERLTSDDCLVLVKTKIEKSSYRTRVRKYILNIIHHERNAMSQDKSYKPQYSDQITIPNKKDGVVFIKINNDRSYIDSVSSKVNHPKYNGLNSNDNVNLHLPYKPGKVVAADFVFIQTAKKVSSTGIRTSSGFIDITPSEKAALLNVALEDNRFSSWWD